MSRILALPLLALILTSLGCSNDDQHYEWPLREGFPKPQVPLTNPMSKAKVELGRHLFYDVGLSHNQTLSCASCHIQAKAFSDPRPKSIGSDGDTLRRNAPALVNIAYNKTLTWAHSEITSIEAQLLLPMFAESPKELGITGNEDKILQRFNLPVYLELFEQAFGDNNLNFDRINKALASFVRSLLSLNSPFDRYAYDGDDSALSEQAIRGMALFFSEKFECHHCHGGFNFTQSTVHQQQLLDRKPFHNTGLYNIGNSGNYPITDQGLYEITGNTADKGKFRAPTLRNVEVTAPYMHDGSIMSLREVVTFYANGGRNILTGPLSGDGRNHPNKSEFLRGFELSKDELDDLIAFLHSLTDTSFMTNPHYWPPETLPNRAQ